MEEEDNTDTTINSCGSKHRNNCAEAKDPSKISSPTPHPLATTATASQPRSSYPKEGGKGTLRMQSLEEDNNRLRERVAHAENLGVLFADAEEQKIKLMEENLALRKRLDQLEAILVEKRTHKKLPDTIFSKPATSYQPSMKLNPTPTQPSTVDEELQTMLIAIPEQSQALKTDPPVASDDDVIRVASLFLSRAACASQFPEQEAPTQEKTSNASSPSSEATTENDKTEKLVLTNGTQSKSDSSSETDEIQDNFSVTSDDENVQNSANSAERTCLNKESCHLAARTDIGQSPTLTGNRTEAENISPEKDRTIVEHHKRDNDRTLTEHHKQKAEQNPFVEEDKFNQEIQQLEDMVQSESSEECAASLNESSMTFQFTKIAGVFASLAQRVVKSQKQAKNSQAFCDALIAENKNLKSHLKSCKQQLEEAKRGMPPRHTSTTATQTPGEPQKSEDQPVSKLQARVKKLEKQREEILRVNKNWDTQYRKLKEELDRKTSSAPQEGVFAMGELPGSSKESPRKIEGEKSSSSSRHQATKQIQTLKHEVSRLRQTVSDMESEKGCLKAENARLNQALEATYSVYERRCSIPRQDKHDLALTPYSSDHKEVLSSESSVVDDLRTHIEVLQEQVKIYREDFETERKDRERSQNEKQKVQEALVRSRREVQTLTQQIRSHEVSFQRERREKEKAQKQLRSCQRTHGRETGGTRRRDRYYGDTNEPPAYHGHRRVDGANPTYSPTNNGRRRNRQAHHVYEATANDLWFERESPDEEGLPLKSPGAEDELDPLY